LGSFYPGSIKILFLTSTVNSSSNPGSGDIGFILLPGVCNFGLKKSLFKVQINAASPDAVPAFYKPFIKIKH